MSRAMAHSSDAPMSFPAQDVLSLIAHYNRGLEVHRKQVICHPDNCNVSSTWEDRRQIGATQLWLSDLHLLRVSLLVSMFSLWHAQDTSADGVMVQQTPEYGPRFVASRADASPFPREN